MKFISKYQNHLVVLRPGIEGNRITGEPMRPGVTVKFEDGVAIIDDDNTELIEMLRMDAKFGTDFIEVKPDDVDPYAAKRTPSEPEHDLIDIEYGHIGKQRNPKKPNAMTADQQAALRKMATEIAMELAPKLAEQMVAAKSEKAPEPVEESAETPEPEPAEIPGETKENPADEGKATPEPSEKKAGRPKKSSIKPIKKTEKGTSEKSQD